ncbi:hypothetical protein DPMN_108323 [Dreissena polymorpha]|uniref:Uncharacterized protein n=1 Tax=Dreissena polymorpha TaxID=45954 RepID=A0A9D4QLY7_DREPO|nr:hypothetical protein DPMN_108323 [Dreissena polymorpha]
MSKIQFTTGSLDAFFSMISNDLNELRLSCSTKFVLGFKEDRRMGARFMRQHVFTGKILRFQRCKETLYQKGRINSMVFSNLNNGAVPKSFSCCVFS